MFKRALDEAGHRAPVAFFFDGTAMVAREGDSVAAALIANGIKAVRHTPAQGQPRAPYCMMGVCFDCLVTIDGAANQQACLVAVAPGMSVCTQARAMPLASASKGAQ